MQHVDLMQKVEHLSVWGSKVCCSSFLFVCCLGLAWFSYGLSPLNTDVAHVWLTNSFAIAWLINRRENEWLTGLLIVVLAVAVGGYLSGLTLGLSAALGVAHSVDITIALVLLRRWRIQESPLTLKSTVTALALCLFPAAFTGAIIGASAFSFNTDHSWITLATRWWFGDAIGALLILIPGLLVTASVRDVRLSRDALWLDLLLLIGLVAILHVLLKLVPFPLTYAPFPFILVAIIWGALRAAVLANVAGIVIGSGSYFGWWQFPLFSAEPLTQGVWVACATVVFAPVLLGIAVEEIKRRQTQLKELTDRFEMASRAIGLGLWDWNFKTGEIYWDDNMYQLYGLDPSAEPLTVECWKKRVHPQDIEVAYNALSLAIAGKDEYQAEFRIDTPDGQYRSLQACGLVLRDPQNQAKRMVGMNWEVSDLVNAQDARMLAEEKLNSVVEAASEFSIIATDKQGLIQVFSAGAERLLGYSKEEMINRMTPAVFHDAEEMKQRSKFLGKKLNRAIVGFEVFVALARDGETDVNEWTYVRKDGNRVPVSLTITTIKSPEGEVMGFLGVARDITLQKQAEQEVLTAQRGLEQQIKIAKQTKDEFETLFEYSPVGMFVINDDGLIVKANSRVHQLCGYLNGSLIGKGISVVVPDLQVLQAVLSADLNLDLKTQKQIQCDCRRRNGSRFMGALELRPLLLNGVKHTMAIVNDISAQVAVEEALQRSRDLAQSANRAKTEFLANMSHEIRTPLNAVLGSAQLLEFTALDRQQNQFVRMISEASKALLDLLSDVLDVSKIEAGKLELVVEPFYLVDVLNSVATIMTVNAATKDIELAIEVDPKVPFHFLGDSVRLQQILVNLTGNAIKFTTLGEVVLAIDFEAVDKNTGYLVVSIRDTGIGLSVEQQHRLFKPFIQGDGSITRKYGGTGLGLTITRKLVELMDGDIRVESEPDKGSEFTCRLKLNYEGYTKRRDQMPRELKRHVMVLDTHAPSLRSIANIILSWGWGCETFMTSARALERLGRTQYPFDVLIVNQMFYKDLAHHYARIPTIQLGSGMASDGDSDSTIYLVKPVTALHLKSAMNDILSRNSTSEDNDLRSLYLSFAPELPKANVLLVEDNPLNRNLVEGLLVELGVLVTAANNGAEAVAQLKQKTVTFDLVLMDVQMPIMDGFSATRVIRDELRMTVPIIAMTAGVLAYERQQCLECGMSDFVGKPIDVRLFLKVLAKYLTGQQSDPSVTPIDTGPQKPILIVNNSKEQPFNPEHLVRYMKDKPERQRELLRLIERIVENGMQPHEQGLALLQEANWQEMSRLFHRLRGSLGNFGAHEVCKTAMAIEAAINEQHYDALGELLQRFKLALEAMLVSAEEWLAQHPESHSA